MTDRAVRIAQGWSPWSGAEALRWAALAVAGHVICGAGWWMVHQRSTFDGRITPIEIAVLGLVLVIFADVSWLLRARFALLTRRRALLDDMVDEPAAVIASPPAVVVGGSGLERYHRPSCPLAAGKQWPVLEDRGRDRQPCGVCKP
jgi:hypothetical protein